MQLERLIEIEKQMRQNNAFSIVFMVAFGIVSLPMLAIAPNNGDGFEVMQTALNGGVMHPPGFPFQAWLNRAAVHFPIGPLATRIAFVSFCFHLLSIYCVSETLRLLKVNILGMGVGALFWGTLPSVWHSGLIPELFAGGNFFMAFLFLFTVKTQTEDRFRSRRNAFLLGSSVACAAATHPITLFAFPSFLLAAWNLTQPPHQRVRHMATMGAAFIVVFIVLFGSLRVLHIGPVWPNWGDIQSLEGLFRHILRLDYGGFSMAASSDQTAELTYGISHFFSFLGAHPIFTAVLCCLGAARAWIVLPSFLRAHLFGSFFASLILLYFSKLDASPTWAIAVIERLFGPTALCLSIFVGTIFARTDQARSRDATEEQQASQSLRNLLLLKHPWVRNSAYALSVVGVLFSAVTHKTHVDVSEENTIPLLMEAISLSLPEDAFFVATDDADSFGPIPEGDTVRYAIAAGLLKVDWYLEKVWKVEPRLSQGGGAGLPTLIDAVLSEGFSIAAASPLEHPTSIPQVRGVLYVSVPGNQDAIGPKTVTTAAKLCPVIHGLSELPSHGHRLVRLRRYRFARAFDAAGEYLKRVNSLQSAETSKAAFAVARAVENATDASLWQKACIDYVRLLNSPWERAPKDTAPPQQSD